MQLRATKLVAVPVFVSLFLFTSQIEALNKPRGPLPAEAGAARAASGKCDPKKSKTFQSLLPCAWDEARRQMREKYPAWSDRIRRLKRPEIRFRDGDWYDPELGDYVVGDTDPDGDPPIQIGLVGDNQFDYETTVHEYKHYIVDRLELGEEAHRWIDSDDDASQ